MTMSPCEMWSPENFLNNQIGHESAVPSISIRKTMNAYQTVFEPNGYFIGSKGLVIDPKQGVIEQFF